LSILTDFEWSLLLLLLESSSEKFFSY